MDYQTYTDEELSRFLGEAVLKSDYKTYSAITAELKLRRNFAQTTDTWSLEEV